MSTMTITGLINKCINELPDSMSKLEKEQQRSRLYQAALSEAMACCDKGQRIDAVERVKDQIVGIKREVAA